MKIKTLQYQCNDADINQVFANRFVIPCVTLCDTLCYVVPPCAFYQQSFTNQHNPLHFVSQGLFDWTKKSFSLSLSLYLSNVIILNECCSLSFAHAHALSLCFLVLALRRINLLSIIVGNYLPDHQNRSFTQRTGSYAMQLLKPNNHSSISHHHLTDGRTLNAFFEFLPAGFLLLFFGTLLIGIPFNFFLSLICVCLFVYYQRRSIAIIPPQF